MTHFAGMAIITFESEGDAMNMEEAWTDISMVGRKIFVTKPPQGFPGTG